MSIGFVFCLPSSTLLHCWIVGCQRTERERSTGGVLAATGAKVPLAGSSTADATQIQCSENPWPPYPVDGGGVALSLRGSRGRDEGEVGTGGPGPGRPPNRVHWSRRVVASSGGKRNGVRAERVHRLSARPRGRRRKAATCAGPFRAKSSGRFSKRVVFLFTEWRNGEMAMWRAHTTRLSVGSTTRASRLLASFNYRTRNKITYQKINLHSLFVYAAHFHNFDF